MSSIISRQRSFFYPFLAGESHSEYVDISSSFVVGSVFRDIGDLTVSDALIQRLPTWNTFQDWSSDPLFYTSRIEGSIGTNFNGVSISFFDNSSQTSTADGWVILSDNDIDNNLTRSHLVNISDLGSVDSSVVADFIFSSDLFDVLLHQYSSDLIVSLANLDDSSLISLFDYSSSPNPTLNALWPSPSFDSDLKLFDASLVHHDSTTDFTLFTAYIISDVSETGLIPNGDSDVLISAHTADGTLLWELLFGNSSVEESPSIVASSLYDSIFIGATISGSLGKNLSGGSKDIGLSRYDLNGDLIWQRVLGSTGNQVLTDLLVTDSGNLLVLGHTSGSSEGLYGQSLIGDGSDVDSFLTAYSIDGERLWTHQFGSEFDDIMLTMDLQQVPDIGSTSDNLITSESLVLAGFVQAAQKQGWIELIDLSNTHDGDSPFLPPTRPTIDLTQDQFVSTAGIPSLVIEGFVSNESFQVSLNGSSDPGDSVSIRLNTTSGANLSTVSVQSDSNDGTWSAVVPLGVLTAQDLGQILVIVQSTNSDGLISDSVVEPFLLTGSGLPDNLPELFPIDIDGPDGSVEPILMQRQITRLGSGPLTHYGQPLLVDYSGRLTDGTLFDSSHNNDRLPFGLTLGVDSVIEGWNSGLQGLPFGSAVELVIPPGLAYGNNNEHPLQNSTLVFEVEFRADFESAEYFLSRILPLKLPNSAFDYSDFINNGIDVFNVGLRYGLDMGSKQDDEFHLVPFTDGNGLNQFDDFPNGSEYFPLIVLGDDGDDVISSTLQASLLFGEWGDDQLYSYSNDFIYLDGGEGNDQLYTDALVSWTRGASGIDTLTLPVGNWQITGQDNYLDDTLFELVRYRTDPLVGEDLIQQIVYSHGVENVILSSEGYLVDFLSISQSSQFTGLHSSTVLLSDSVLSSVDLLNFLEISSGLTVDLSNVTELRGSLDDLLLLSLNEALLGFSDRSLIISDSVVSASSLLSLLSSTEGTINLLNITDLNGDFNSRSLIFEEPRIISLLEDDQPPFLVSISSPAGSFGSDATISFSLEFSEPVSFDNSSLIPTLLLSNGLHANWVKPSSNDSPTSTLQFDLLTGSLLNNSYDVQPVELTNFSGFSDAYGNDLLQPDENALLLSTPLDFFNESWSLDLDSDGLITPLGDGLMLIRHLFGTFKGEDLVSKAISPSSPYLSEGIVVAASHVTDNIQEGIDSGLLDVDGDGSVTPLGDGLMILRHLFGFSGESLVSKSISTSSPLLLDEDLNLLEASSVVAAHINSLHLTDIP